MGLEVVMIARMMARMGIIIVALRALGCAIAVAEAATIARMTARKGTIIVAEADLLPHRARRHLLGRLQVQPMRIVPQRKASGMTVRFNFTGMVGPSLDREVCTAS